MSAIAAGDLVKSLLAGHKALGIVIFIGSAQDGRELGYWDWTDLTFLSYDYVLVQWDTGECASVPSMFVQRVDEPINPGPTG